MQLKNTLIKKLFFSIHIGIILLTACTLGINSSMSFYEYKPPKFIGEALDFCSEIISTSPIKYYSILAGIDTGYVFYAPNVKATSLILIETEDEIFVPRLKTHEGNHMLNVLVGSMTNQIVGDLEEDKKESEEKTVGALLNELLLKNIGIYTFSQAKTEMECKDFQLHYCLVDYPSLADSKLGLTEPEIIKTKTLHISQ